MNNTGRCPAIFIVSAKSQELAERIRHAAGGEIWAPVAMAGTCDHTYESFEAALGVAFLQRRPIVGICAAGILIRMLAPLIDDKLEESPVLAVAWDGGAVVPLLGGHRGANDLARSLATALGSKAVITTAGDIAFGVALDAPPFGWRLRNPGNAKKAMSALLSGARARVVVEDGPEPAWLAGLPRSPDGEILITISTRAGAEGDLVYAPQVVALGVGCERMVGEGDLIDLAYGALSDADIAPESVACVASIDLKAAEPALHALSERLGVPARFFDAARLEEERERLVNPSEVVFRETGCHGVAEGAALAAVGKNGSLVLPKQRGNRTTVAAAKAREPLDLTTIGRARGRLFILGIGPGLAAARTREVEEAITLVSDVVGYTLYLDLLGRLIAGKTSHKSQLGEEAQRARLALDLAASGRQVALVSSGDAGIYAMASLVFELIDREDRPEWTRVEVCCLPGVSAMQSAASRAGAPLGHDFCAISLSDLLTPWATIERRLQAAADVDFVVALYNPVSRKRTSQLARAREILLKHRSPETPIVLARNLGRPGEMTRISTLGALNPADVDMLTIVIVGASTTRTIERPDGGKWVYTPRGYDHRTVPGSRVAE